MVARATFLFSYLHCENFIFVPLQVCCGFFCFYSFSFDHTRNIRLESIHPAKSSSQGNVTSRGERKGQRWGRRLSWAGLAP